MHLHHMPTYPTWQEATRRWPILVEIDEALRCVPISNRRDLHGVLDDVYAAIECLPTSWQITVTCHLGRVADDVADTWEAGR